MLPGRSRSSENIEVDGSSLNQEDSCSQPKRTGRPRVRSRQPDRYVRLEEAPVAEDYVASRSRKRAHPNHHDDNSTTARDHSSLGSISTSRASEPASQGTDTESAEPGGFWSALTGLMTCSRFTPFGWPCLYPLSRHG